MGNEQIQPIFILPEGSNRSMGKDAQRNNIFAAKAVADIVRTTLGPLGMDKMLVDSTGDIIITNDGVTILKEMNVEHPIAKMIVEVAKTQEEEVGDGTTTAVVIAGELLKKTEALLDQNVHPTVIARGYRQASEISQIVLKEIAESINISDKKLLENIAVTAMTGKGAEIAKDCLSKIAVTAVESVTQIDGKKITVDLDNIQIEKKTGGGIEDTEVIQGIIIDKEKIHPNMPNFVKNAKIALIDCALEIKETGTDAKISITSPDQLQAFVEKEESMLKNMVLKVKKSGATVLFCQKGIDDIAQHFLAKEGIFAARRVKQSDMEKLAKATGGHVINSLNDLESGDLGDAGLVEEKKIAGESMIFVRECKNAKAVSILIRGGTEHIVENVKRAMDDALGGIATSLEVSKVVGGGGAPEVEVSRRLRSYAEKISGREQLAVLAFAEALEIIPRTLAENAGLDSIDMMVKLKSEHDKGIKWAGVDVFSGKVEDMWKKGVVEPLKIKTQAIKSASEVACLILRIDDIIASKGNGRGGMPSMPQGMGPGMY